MIMTETEKNRSVAAPLWCIAAIVLAGLVYYVVTDQMRAPPKPMHPMEKVLRDELARKYLTGEITPEQGAKEQAQLDAIYGRR